MFNCLLPLASCLYCLDCVDCLYCLYCLDCVYCVYSVCVELFVQSRVVMYLLLLALC